jgi:hypothetical protein
MANGIRINIRITNTSDRSSSVGLRFLLDTYLGEGRREAPFFTDQRSLTEEALLEGDASDRWWVSGNNRMGLMGNISPVEGTKPDFIHFANWKRFNDVTWRLSYVPGRNFNFLPYSIGDSAVCYYFNPLPLDRGASRILSVFLALENGQGFSSVSYPGALDQPPNLQETSREPPPRELQPAFQASAVESEDNTLNTDLRLLQEMLDLLNAYIADERTLSDEDLSEMEKAVDILKNRYGFSMNR